MIWTTPPQTAEIITNQENNMMFTITKIESKNNDWKIANVTGVDGTNYKDCSINRASKKGEVFPNFDELDEGKTIEAEYWRSGAGKNYLFPPRAKKTTATRKTFDATVVMEKKAMNIERSQDRKEDGIKISATARDATLIMVALMTKEDFDYQEKWLEVREWLWNNWEYTESPLDNPENIPF